MDEKYEMARIGARLRESRLEAGLTQSEAGDAVGVDRSVLSRWESGDSAPNVVQYKALLVAYGELGYYILFGQNPLTITSEDATLISRYAEQAAPEMQGRLTAMIAVLTKAARRSP